MRKKELLKKVRIEIRKIADELKLKPIEELRTYISNDFNDKLDIEGNVISLMIWAEEHGLDKIAVVVHASRERFFGMWANVTAEGFFKLSDGSTIDFKEYDYYEHGY